MEFLLLLKQLLMLTMTTLLKKKKKKSHVTTVWHHLVIRCDGGFMLLRRPPWGEIFGSYRVYFWKSTLYIAIYDNLAPIWLFKKKKNMFLKSAWNQNVKYSFCKHSLLVLRWEIKPWKLITWKKKKITLIFRFSWKIRHYMQQLPVQTDFKYINVLKKIIISQKK